MAQTDDRLTPGFIQETLQRLKRIQKSRQIEGLPTGGVTINYDLNTGLATGTFIFPITQEEQGGNTIIKTVDFAQ